MELGKQILSGDSRALSKAISLIEQGHPYGPKIMRYVHSYTGKSYTVGITGPPGAGKSTIIAGLTGMYRAEGKSVGVVAADPSSPYSGGALLGDRIRMEPYYLDSNVFIRSMATRGGTGGLPRIIKCVVRLLDAFGKDVVLVETVGVGQTELDITNVADIVVVILVPEAGDVIQTLKAGIMEIGDIFVVNKADRPGADKMMAQVKTLISMGDTGIGGSTSVLATEATKTKGISDLWNTIQTHHDILSTNLLLEKRRTNRRSKEFLEVLEEEIGNKVRDRLRSEPTLAALLDEIRRGESEPYSAAMALLEDESSPLRWLSSPWC